eukprot:jgi/Psemu1/183938/e_gw1.35.116.1
MASIRTAKPYVATRICRIGCSTGSSRGTRTVAEGPIALRKPSLATRSFSSSSSSLSSSQPVIELREDFLIPRHATSYFEAVSEHYSGAAAPAPPPNLCFLSRQELGGDANVATHAYCYQGGLTELQEKRKIIENDNGMQGFDDLQSYILSQRSSVYVEAPLVNEQSDYVVGLGNTTKTVADNDDDDDDDDNNDCIFELRRYHLKLGYDTVPKFLDLYGAGLPSKLRAPGTDPRTGLVTLLYSEVGRLNEVIEIWRHGNGVPGMEQSRVAARKANEWRGAIANIADLAIEFHSTIHRPVWTALPPSKKK